MAALSDELERLAQLRDRGVLTEAEFVRAKASVIDGQAGTATLQAINALRRSRDDRWLGGVCGGVARLTGVGSWVWRLMFVLLALAGGTGVVAYLLLWVLLPADPLLPGRPQGQPQAG